MSLENSPSDHISESSLASASEENKKQQTPFKGLAIDAGKEVFSRLLPNPIIAARHTMELVGGTNLLTGEDLTTTDKAKAAYELGKIGIKTAQPEIGMAITGAELAYKGAELTYKYGPDFAYRMGQRILKKVRSF